MSDRLLNTFLDLVKIDSETFHEASAAEYVMEAARQAGFDSFMDNAGKSIGGDSGNVYVKIPASGVIAPPIMFCSHLDTVSPGKGVVPVLKKGLVFSEGKTVLGADCKAGVSAMVEIMRLAGEGALEHGPLELVFTVAEERQLQGVQHIELDRIESKWAFVLDGAGYVGDLINASPTQDNLEFVFNGRAAHAGVEPEKGINAIYGASWAVSLMRLGRIDMETTANIGVIEGGHAVNIVPDRVVVKGEVRSHDLSKLEEQRKSMAKAVMEAEAAVGVGIEIKVERAYDGYLIQQDDPLVQLVAEAGKAMGMKVEAKPSGGGSDANYLNASGIKSVVLGMGVRESHTINEVLEIEELQRLVRLCKEIAGVAGRLRGAT
jgi:tripeptide aminopeptidase